MAPERRLYDVSRRLSPDIAVWPGDEPPAFTPVLRLDKGNPVNLDRIALSPHTGTHFDAPRHVFDGGAAVDELPLEVCIGEALLVDLSPRAPLPAVTVDCLPDAPWPSRMLFRTGAGDHADEDWPVPFAAIHPDAAEALVAGGVRLVGTDAPSIDPQDSESLATHGILLAAGVVVIENLVLTAVPAGRYELLALPLPLVGVDGSPARVVLRTL